MRKLIDEYYNLNVKKLLLLQSINPDKNELFDIDYKLNIIFNELSILKLEISKIENNKFDIITNSKSNNLINRSIEK